MKLLSLLLLALVACESGPYRWEPPLEREDQRSCNGARGGEAWSAEYRYLKCLESMGYKRVEIPK